MTPLVQKQKKCRDSMSNPCIVVLTREIDLLFLLQNKYQLCTKKYQ